MSLLSTDIEWACQDLWGTYDYVDFCLMATYRLLSRPFTVRSRTKKSLGLCQVALDVLASLLLLTKNVSKPSLVWACSSHGLLVKTSSGQDHTVIDFERSLSHVQWLPKDYTWIRMIVYLLKHVLTFTCNDLCLLSILWFVMTVHHVRREVNGFQLFSMNFDDFYWVLMTP